jgi:hypothetical protein
MIRGRVIGPRSADEPGSCEFIEHDYLVQALGPRLQRPEWRLSGKGHPRVGRDA